MLKSFFVTVYIIAFLSILQSEIILPPDSLENWEILQEGEIWVGWEHSGGIDWCRSKTIINAPMADIQKSIENAENYPTIIKSIVNTKMITDEIVYIVVDMPYLFSSRDYVVKYIIEKQENDYIYSYYAVIHPDVPLDKNYVRLNRSSGEWRLQALDSTHTEFTYTWNGELLGNFPNWALPRAWKEQGIEVVTGFKKAVE